jgi:hypothetical protein
MDVRPLGMARTRRGKLVSLWPYLLAGYALLLIAVVLLSSWAERF